MFQKLGSALPGNVSALEATFLLISLFDISLSIRPCPHYDEQKL